MQCPFCKQSKESRVMESRSIEEQQCIRRRRECQSCQKRFTTYERVKEWEYLVIKKEARREQFDVDKLKKGLFRAFQGRSTSRHKLEKIAIRIEQQIRERFPQEVSSKDIGLIVLSEIKNHDEVAYIRFASVYHNFDDLSHFIEEIRSLNPNQADFRLKGNDVM